MERSVVFFTVPELISIMFLILLSVVGIILCLRSKYMNEAEHFVNGAAEVTNDALESYIIYCRNEAIKKYMEEMAKRAEARRAHPEIHVQYWDYTPEFAAYEFRKFADELVKIKNPHKTMLYYYRSLPEVIYSFVAAEPDSDYHGDNIMFIAGMKRFYLDRETRRSVEAAIKNKTELPIY